MGNLGPMATAQSKRLEELADLKRELGSLNVWLSVLGERSQVSGELTAKKEKILEKIRLLESEIKDRETPV